MRPGSRKRSIAATGLKAPADPTVGPHPLRLPSLVHRHDIRHGLPFEFGDTGGFQVLREPCHHAAGAGIRNIKAVRANGPSESDFLQQ